MTEEKWNEAVQAMEEAGAALRAELAAARLEVAVANAQIEKLKTLLVASGSAKAGDDQKGGEL